MASLRKDEWNNWILRYRVGGRGSRIVYTNLKKITHAEAKERMRALLAEADASKTLADPNVTFGRLVSLWQRLRGGEMAAGTLRSNASILSRHVLPRFGAAPVKDLRPADLMGYRVDRLAEKRPPAAWTMNRELSLVRSVLNFGEVSGVVRNPIPRGAVKPLATKLKTVYF